MKRFLSAPAAALALLLLTGMGVHADPLPSTLSWTYNFTPGLSSLPATTGTGNISFTNEPNNTGVTGTSVVGTSLRTASTASPSTPDTISGSGGSYTLSLTLMSTDDAGPHQTVLTFHGQLSGYFSQYGAKVANIISDPIQSVTLGSYTFAVNMDAYTPPGGPGQTNPGSIGGYIDVTAASTPTPTSDTPEPGTMVLAGLGLSAFGGAAWRKRRQARAAVAV